MGSIRAGVRKALSLRIGVRETERIMLGDSLIWSMDPDQQYTATEFTLELTSDLTQTIYFTQSEKNGIIVDWGDGSESESFDGDDSVTSGDYAVQATHTFAKAGKYLVSLTPKKNVSLWPGCQFKNGSGLNRYGLMTSSLNKGGNNATLTMFRFGSRCGLNEYAFNGCSALTSINAPTAPPKGMSLYRAFRYCTALTSIPPTLFYYCAEIVSFQDCFFNCSALKAIPPRLFDHCISALHFSGCFFGCAAIKSIPAGLFDHCRRVTEFGGSPTSDNSGCFQSCTSLSSIPSGLFDHCPEVTDFINCFKECTAIESIPAGLFDHCCSVDDFSGCFADCTSLTSIPDGLFTYCSKVLIFGLDNLRAGCFQGCTSLTAIPISLFNSCTQVQYFSRCFSGCAAITGAVPELWDDSIWVTVHNGHSCFAGCINASNYKDIPSSWGGPSQ